MNKTKGRISRSPEVDKPKAKPRKSRLSSDKNKQQKSRDSNGQSSIISFFQNKNEDSKATTVVPLDDSLDSDFEELKKKVSFDENEPLSDKKNAFTFMMDNRFKSIGQNSPGKDLDKVEEANDVKDEKKRKLADRKSAFQDWADRKGGKKRKLEDKERGVIIEKKLEDRSKRLKKMLKVEAEKKPRKKSKNGHQKENNMFQLKGNGDKAKWRMRLRINLTEEETSKLTVSLKKLDKPTKKLGSVDSNQLKDRNSKVAPVFQTGKKKSKLDEKAKKEFLHSDLPEGVKKHIDKHQRVEIPDYIIFPKVSHIKIKPNEDQLQLLNQPPAQLAFSEVDSAVPTVGVLTKGCITKSSESATQQIPTTFPKIRHYKKLLERIKEENPDYPVFKVFKYVYSVHKLDHDVEVRAKNTDQLQMWTDLYKPDSSENIFGNKSAVSEIKTWLETWVECSVRKRRRRSSDSSDFETDGEDSRDAALPKNTVILHGPHGCGKTMTVYAICKELGINILEVNASSKRTGKKLLIELQEATQSHQVRKNKNLFNGFLQRKPNETIPSDKMCLLLIEDVDVVFEQDDGFINGLSQLLTTSKRPVILTTTDKNCVYLQRFTSVYSTVPFSKLSQRVLSPWLQLICLTEGYFVDKESITSLLEKNKLDARSTLLQLEFWSRTGGQLSIVQDDIDLRTSDDITISDNICQDDNSNMSYLKNEEEPIETSTTSQRIYTKSFQKSEFVDLDSTWWSLDINTDSSIKDVLNVLESLGTTDCVYRKLHIDQYSKFTSDSLELTESEEVYSSCKDACSNWTKDLLEGYLGVIRSKRTQCCDLPDRARLIRRSKCNDTLLEIVPLVCHLQRDSVNLDYLSTLRTINRTEKVRAITNKKRKSRFYNYLRGLGLNCSETSFSTLSSIFSLEDT